MPLKFQFEEKLNAVDDVLASYFSRKMDNDMETKYNFYKAKILQKRYEAEVNLDILHFLRFCF